ncbi:DM13 domain-containing protein [Calothrix sp. UHCC 0171]|uniref:DM13 domain-containing protein n=1 Tax=Calothrix sp. UHCC 0171 TaxID=3110245 RepID=UPI002B207BF4|nr:DM13 domain-containing protein [Calothrix sp. UHCC 0171]MEA5570346.1 DM13 domain-containing protein [Calothrix sp. UHCC 0171]
MMKFKLIPLMAIGLSLIVSCSREVSSNSPQTDTSSTTSVRTKSQASTAKIGSFVPARYSTEGNARIVRENGRSFVEFDQGFKTDNGPDLFVILYRNSSVPNSGVREKDYVRLAALQKTRGSQRYAIPEDIALADFKSVAIWCRQFNSTFGYATLSS